MEITSLNPWKLARPLLPAAAVPHPRRDLRRWRLAVASLGGPLALGECTGWADAVRPTGLDVLCGAAGSAPRILRHELFAHLRLGFVRELRDDCLSFFWGIVVLFSV